MLEYSLSGYSKILSKIKKKSLNLLVNFHKLTAQRQVIGWLDDEMQIFLASAAPPLIDSKWTHDLAPPGKWQDLRRCRRKISYRNYFIISWYREDNEFLKSTVRCLAICKEWRSVGLKLQLNNASIRSDTIRVVICYWFSICWKNGHKNTKIF